MILIPNPPKRRQQHFNRSSNQLLISYGSLREMPLFSKSLSPSRSTLSIPQVSGGTASAVHSLASSRSPSPSAPANQRENPKRMQDDTFRNVKLVEELLRAWNDHRQALSACAKTGKRLAKAMDELSQGLDKTSITCM